MPLSKKQQISPSPAATAAPTPTAAAAAAKAKSSSSPPMSPSRKSSSSLASSHTFRPRLIRNLADLPDISADAGGILAPPRPRRLWKVSDTKLRPFPPYYPRDPRCMRLVPDDTPASVIAIRIAECLRRRSIAVEYDDEAATATCLTVDRCHFTVALWRATTEHSKNVVLVEGIRSRGSLLSFHRTLYAILEAAVSHDSGADRRQVYQSSPLEYKRLTMHATEAEEKSIPLPTKHASALSSAAILAMEEIVHLLRKDRLEAQVLGMERLVSLTDVYTSGTDTAMYVALAVLGAPISSSEDVVLLREIHEQWIMRLLIDRVLPGESTVPELADAAAAAASTPNFGFSCATSLFGDETPANLRKQRELQQQQQQQQSQQMGDELHGGRLRALALRALTNSLSLLEDKQPKILESVLSVQSPRLVETSLIAALLDDLAGASRPPAVVAGTRLACQHEAVLSVRCLRILGSHSPKAKQRITSPATMGLLEKARSVGQSTHSVLADEAQKSYHILTEDFRSC